MDLQMPQTVRMTEPRPKTPGAGLWIFDHIPSLRELLPKHRGRPGLEYFQCCVTNLRRAQDEGWLEVDNTVIYTVVGPRGQAHMKLMARGRLIPGQSHDSGARLCFCDRTIEPMTGHWINPNRHEKDSIPSPDPVETFPSEPSEILETPGGAVTLSSATEEPRVYQGGTPKTKPKEVPENGQE